MYTPVVYKIDLLHLLTTGLEDLRNRMPQQIISNVTQMEWLLVLGDEYSIITLGADATTSVFP